MKILLALTAAAAITGAASADHHGANSLHGVWETDYFVMTMTPYGNLVAATHDGVAMAVLQYSVDGDQITARDLSPPSNASAEEAECGMSNDAVFTYAIEGDQLTFSVVADPCEGRAEAINGTVMTRRAMPAPAE